MLYISEIKVGLFVTYRLSAGPAFDSEPLPSLYRAQVYYVWERSSVLREYAGQGWAMHPADWQWDATCWATHAPLDAVLAFQGCEETATGFWSGPPDGEAFDPWLDGPLTQAEAA